MHRLASCRLPSVSLWLSLPPSCCMPSSPSLLSSCSCSIRILDLTSNRLQEIPKEIEHLINVEILKIGQNCITELPNEIGNLTKIKVQTLSMPVANQRTLHSIVSRELFVVFETKHICFSVPLERRSSSVYLGNTFIGLLWVWMQCTCSLCI